MVQCRGTERLCGALFKDFVFAASRREVTCTPTQPRRIAKEFITMTLKPFTAAALAVLTLLGSSLMGSSLMGSSAASAAAVVKKNAVAAPVKTSSGHEARGHWNEFANSSTACSVYFDKWKSTGTGFWKGRYYACIHGW